MDTVLFIDVENVVWSLRNERGRSFDIVEIIEKAGGWSRMALAVAYADFTNVPEAVAQGLRHAGVRCEHVARAKGSAKDLDDICLSLDLLELALTDQEVTRFVVAGGDSHYIPIASKLLGRTGRRFELLAVEGSLSSELRQLVGGKHVQFLKGGRPLRSAAQPRRTVVGKS